MSVTLIYLAITSFVLVSADEYLEEVQSQCYASDYNLFSCAKLKALRYLKNYQFEPVETSRSNGGFLSGLLRLRKIPDADNNATLFGDSRQLSGDSEYTKFIKFLKRQVSLFINSQGVGIDLPEEARLLEERKGT